MTITLAEQAAERDGLPVVLAIPFELLRIAEGNPMVLSTTNGGRVLVRLPTPQEYADVVRTYRDALPADAVPSMPSAEQIADLVRPLRWPS